MLISLLPSIPSNFLSRFMGNRKRRKTDENERTVVGTLYYHSRSRLPSNVISISVDGTLCSRVAQLDLTPPYGIMSKITILVLNPVGPIGWTTLRAHKLPETSKQARIVICRARERMGGPRAGWLRLAEGGRIIFTAFPRHRRERGRRA